MKLSTVLNTHAAAFVVGGIMGLSLYGIPERMSGNDYAKELRESGVIEKDEVVKVEKVGTTTCYSISHLIDGKKDLHENRRVVCMPVESSLDYFQGLLSPLGSKGYWHHQ